MRNAQPAVLFVTVFFCAFCFVGVSQTQDSYDRELIGGTGGLGGLGPYVNRDRSEFFGRKDKLSMDFLFSAFLEVQISKGVDWILLMHLPRALGTLQNKPMTRIPFMLTLELRQIS